MIADCSPSSIEKFTSRVTWIPPKCLCRPVTSSIAAMTIALAFRRARRNARAIVMAAILEVTGLHKHFGGIHVTRDVNFSMEEGEQSAIIGPNGAGKSTLMNLLTGYHRCDAGKVVFEGQDINNRPPR